MKRLLVLLAVVATPVVGFVPAAHAVGAATCVIGGTMTLTAPSGTGVGAWEINPGLIDCNGAVNGYRIWGSGPFTGRGTYTTLSPAGGPCRHQIGIGMVDYTFQSGAMVFHKQESQRFVVAGGGEFTTPSLRGTLQLAPPYQGDCLTQPVTKATFAAQGVMVWTAPFFFGRSAGRPHGGL